MPDPMPSDTIQLGRLFHANAAPYALRVRGDAMARDHLADGDFVIVEPRAYAFTGDLVVAEVDGGERTLRRYHRSGDSVLLLPDPRGVAVAASRVKIRGVVIGVLRSYADRREG